MTETTARDLRPSIWTIPCDRPFADSLVAGILARYPANPLDLSRLTLLLPSRRAIRAVQEAFLRHTDGRAMLMPIMRAVADVEEEEAGIMGAGMEGLPGGTSPGPGPGPGMGKAESEGQNLLDLPPAIAPGRRQLELTRLVLLARSDIEPAQALQLATELAKFLNQVQAEERQAADLANIDVGNLADHWGQVLAILDIIIRLWPETLAEQGMMDPAARRNALMHGQAEYWRQYPPANPVIAAGITRASPAVAALLSVVTRLPEGHVVMPGLDLGLDDDGWGAIDDAHPQAAMKNLLAGMRVQRGDCADFDWAVDTENRTETARQQFLSLVMRPASTTGAWQSHQLPLDKALSGLVRLDCETPSEEARVIALLMRQQLEHPGKTAALISPDRVLARRVAVELQRWQIDVDDSAGRPLAQTPVGTILRLMLQLIEEDWAPHAFLALARHPLVGGPLAGEERKALVDKLEYKLLRGPRPMAGAEGLLAVLSDEAARIAKKVPEIQIPKWIATAREWITWLADAVSPLQDHLGKQDVSLEILVNIHTETAERFCAGDDRDARHLWRGDDGEAAALFFGDLLDSADVMASMAGRSYPGFIETLMQTVTVRRKYGAHPRLFIWGNIEAQLQQADLLIIGGLNEGVWPPDPQGDPWMSRPMRRDFGLPLPEARIGEAAHDFVQAVAAPHVVMTRAEKNDGVPTVPSRWLLRMDAVLGETGKAILEDNLAAWPDGDPRDWARAMDDVAGPVVPIEPPEPVPPLEFRPDRLAATRIEKWLQDPYAIYAQKILGLHKLDPVDADPGAAEKGTYIHQALENFVEKGQFKTADALRSTAAFDALLEEGRSAFGPMLDRPAVRAFWWPRFVKLATWFLDTEARRADHWHTVSIEAKGKLTIDVDGVPFIAEATADRIDQNREDGSYAMIDYKTGKAPTANKVASGASCQLQLAALMAERGGFDDLPAESASDLSFWELRGAEAEPGKIVSAVKDKDIATLMEEAEQGITELVRAFRHPDQAWLAVPRDDAQPRFNDYQHLERLDEWIMAGDNMDDIAGSDGTGESEETS